jgi:hypothetical protein
VLTIAIKNILNPTIVAGSGEGTTIIMGQDTYTSNLRKKKVHVVLHRWKGLGAIMF